MNRAVEGKVAVVTGASSGIGRATVVELARRGYAVAIHYCSNEQGGRETLAQVQALENGKARVYSADLAVPSEASQMAGDVLADFGRVDVLVNNAGGLIQRKPLAEMEFDLWRRVFAVNLDSVFLVTRAFLPVMAKQRSGVIVNVASVAGRNGGGPGAAAYSTSKGAVITLTKGMAKEFINHGIRVNCVNPGVIDTPFHQRFSTPEMIARFVSQIPQGRTGASEEVASVIAFLVSDESSHIVGESIEVNGGILMD